MGTTPTVRGWIDPVMAYDKRASDGPSRVDQLLRAANGKSRPLFVVGIGFDPRCGVGLRRFIQATGDRPDVLAIDLRDPRGPANEELDAQRTSNAILLQQLAGPGRLEILGYPSVHERAGVGRAIAQDIDALGILDNKENIVVDLSALPTAISFPVMTLLLNRCMETEASANLLVLVVENPKLDAYISEFGASDAAALPGLNSSILARSRNPGTVYVWTPVLGERTGPELDHVAQFLQPNEVCPILPFPSADPRRADRLLLEHRAFLVDQYEVGPESFIYADESNPFDLSQTLVNFFDDYQRALAPLENPPILCASSHSSKLLSVGVLLAAYQRTLPVIATRATSYQLDPRAQASGFDSAGATAVVWLRGDPYRP